MAQDSRYKEWICTKCGHEVLSPYKPASIKWTDLHVCHFVLNADPKRAWDDQLQKVVTVPND